MVRRLLAVAALEVRQQTRQPVWAVACAALLGAALVAGSTDVVRVGDGAPGVWRNAPLAIGESMLAMSMLEVLVVALVVAPALLRDLDLRTRPLLSATRLTKAELVGGRLAAVLVLVAALPLAAAVGLAAAPAMPWAEAERFGPVPLAALWQSAWGLALPNLLLAAFLFAAVAMLARSHAAVFATAVAMLGGYGFAASYLGRLGWQRVAAVADPFGLAAFSLVTRYASVFERNHAALPLAAVLEPKLPWLAAAVALFAVAYRSFDTERERVQRRPAADDEPMPALRPGARAAAPTSPRRRFLHAVGFESRLLLISPPVLVVALLGIANLWGSGRTVGTVFDTEAWPVTRLMVDELRSSYLFFLTIALVFAAAESVWRERSLRVADWLDAAPAPATTFWGAKLVALVVAFVALAAAGIGAGMLLQLSAGYFRLEPGLYAKAFALELAPEYLTTIALALFLLVLAHHKGLGLLLVMAAEVAISLLRATVHPLALFGLGPPRTYSDMNGYGPFVAPMLWLFVYWGAASVVLLVVVALLWPRGVPLTSRQSVREACLRWSRRSAAIAASAGFVTLAAGAVVFVSADVVNDYETPAAKRGKLAALERRYHRFAALPQPKIVEAQVTVDIEPAQERATLRGTYRLENHSAGAIGDVHVFLAPELHLDGLRLVGGGAVRDEADPPLGYHVLHLARPLAAGASAELHFVVTDAHSLFQLGDTAPAVVANGTFFTSRSHLPAIGYPRVERIEGSAERKRYGLHPLARMARPSDPVARRRNELSAQADWIRHFTTTISTSSDQTPIASGRLEAQWASGRRHFARYVVDGPSMFFVGFASARYAVRHRRWDNVDLYVFHDPRHAWNVDTMLAAMEATLAYCTERFGPFPGRELRIVEFPRYRRFAQSLQAMIPFSEDSGFVARVRPGEIDPAFLITAHEVAHQWWAHQAVGADVAGAAMLTESLAQYTAGAVVARTYGEQALRAALRYELDRYLAGRAHEAIAERPLAECEGQPYVHYSKGALALQALAHRIGRDALDAALADYLHTYRYQGPPYPTSRDLLARIAARTPAADRWLLGVLFDTVTLYDLRVAGVRRRGHGAEVAVVLRQLRAEGEGRDREVAPRAWVDVAVVDRRGTELWRGSRLMDQPRATIRVPILPGAVGVVADPDLTLIERDRDDNDAPLDGGGGW